MASRIGKGARRGMLGSAPGMPGTSPMSGGLDATQVSHAPRVRGPADLAKLAFGALGVVYGDIGTSPLYTIKECFSPPHGVAVGVENVLGILSLVFWSLVLLICVKYI